MNFANRSIGVKLTATFAVLIGMFLLVAITTFASLGVIQKADGWNTHTYEVLAHANDLIGGVVNQETGVRGYLVSGDESFLEPYIAGKKAYALSMKALLDLTSDNPAQQARLQKLAQLENEWRTKIAMREIALMKDPATVEQARKIEASGAGKGVMDALRGVHAQFVQEESSLLVVRTQAKNNAALFAEWAIILGSVIIIAAAGALGFLLTRHIGTAVARLTKAMGQLAGGDNTAQVPFTERADEIGEMAKSVLVFKNAAIEKQRIERDADEARQLSDEERIAHEAAKAAEAAQVDAAVEALASGLQRLSLGDLTARIDQPFADSLDRLRSDFNESVEKLGQALVDVTGNIGVIHKNAAEMRSAAEQLSGRTAQQAASLEETSASLEQITATVASSSERAREASLKAADAKSASDSSANVVADAGEAMGRIESASDEIAKIIGVIDEIAFQTNLLALNASVEAARAGVAGTGFAVVAQEVRELAQRSADAAKQIKGLIEKSGTEVQNGVNLVKATEEALNRIAGHVTEINAHIGSIAEAAQEQSIGLQEINTAVSQMDKVTQQNASMVEETTAVTHRLSDNADDLASLVDRFTLARSETTQNRAA